MTSGRSALLSLSGIFSTQKLQNVSKTNFASVSRQRALLKKKVLGTGRVYKTQMGIYQKHEAEYLRR